MSIHRFYKPIFTQRLTQVKNEINGTDLLWDTHIITTGLINLSSSNEVFIVNQKEVLATHKLFTDTDQDVETEDRVVDADGNVYQIISDPQDSVGRGHHWLIHLRKLGITASSFIYVTIDGFIYVTKEA